MKRILVAGIVSDEVLQFLKRQNIYHYKQHGLHIILLPEYATHDNFWGVEDIFSFATENGNTIEEGLSVRFSWNALETDIRLIKLVTLFNEMGDI